MAGLKAKIIAAIERHCSEGASGRLIGADDAAEDILEAIRDPGESGNWPRYSYGEWSRRNVEAYVDDVRDE